MTTEIPEDLQFDHDELDSYDPEDTQRFLEEQPDLYLNHLAIAAHLTDWGNELRNDPHEHDDYVNALDEVAAHLRLGHYLDGGKAAFNR